MKKGLHPNVQESILIVSRSILIEKPPCLTPSLSTGPKRLSGADLQSWRKVSGHFFVSVAFSSSHRSNPSPHPTNNVGRVYPEFFSEFQLCIGWGEGGRTARNFSKRMHCFKRQPRQKNVNTAVLSQGDFCPGLSESWFWGKKSVFFVFPTLF